MGFRFGTDPKAAIDADEAIYTHESAKQYGSLYRQEVKRREEMTGWERVKDLFKYDEWGQIKPELIRANQTVLITMFVGGAIGGIGRSRIAYMNFFRSNAHTAFETPLKARSKLQETVLMGFGSGAWRVGWRCAAFSAIYSLGAACFSAYRGKASVLDPAVGGALAGFVYKFHEGPKFMIAGTTIGGIFGLVGGAITGLALSLSGVSADELLAQSYEQIQLEKKKKYEKMAESRPLIINRPDSVSLSEFHTKMLESIDKDKANEQIASEPTKIDQKPITLKQETSLPPSPSPVDHSSPKSSNNLYT